MRNRLSGFLAGGLALLIGLMAFEAAPWKQQTIFVNSDAPPSRVVHIEPSQSVVEIVKKMFDQCFGQGMDCVPE